MIPEIRKARMYLIQLENDLERVLEKAEELKKENEELKKKIEELNRHTNGKIKQ